MSIPCYVAVTGTDHTTRARFVQFNGYPHHMLAALATIRRRVFGGDTAAMAAALLTHDWELLDPTTRDYDTPAEPGDLPIRGVGIAMTDDPWSAPSDPLTLAPTEHLDVRWLYLLDPATATVTVRGADPGETPTRHRLGH